MKNTNIYAGYRYPSQTISHTEFNGLWQVTYSDGSTMSGINNIIVNETRCIQCQNIICDVEDLPVLQVKQ